MMRKIWMRNNDHHHRLVHRLKDHQVLVVLVMNQLKKILMEKLGKLKEKRNQLLGVEHRNKQQMFGDLIK